jgi:hypothetical protein
MAVVPFPRERKFRWPEGDARLSLIGATGTGKTTAGLWFLSHVRFDKRPWLAIDFKNEELFDRIGFPPIRLLPLGKLPAKRDRGLFLTAPLPGEERELDTLLWRIWERGNIGLFIDEASLMPDSNAFRAILQQGRSKRIPVIACMQRPVGVIRPLFSEATYFGIWRVQDKRDYKVIEGFVPVNFATVDFPPRHWVWYDVAHNVTLRMRPVPPPNLIVAEMHDALRPYTRTHPFQWTQPAPDRREVS